MKNVRREDWVTLKPTVYGWGINDVNYTVQVKVELPSVNGKRMRRRVWTCPYYLDWQNIIGRCFDPKVHKRHPTYKDCTVCEEWKYLSNFIAWVDSQPNRDWQSCQPDKDLLTIGNKCYSPETVTYVSPTVNKFLCNSKAIRGDLMLGVSRTSKNKVNPFVAQCKFSTTGGSYYIGTYKTELEAHKAWQAKKHEYACMLAEEQEDPRVADALRQRYAPDKDWTKA